MGAHPYYSHARDGVRVAKGIGPGHGLAGPRFVLSNLDVFLVVVDAREAIIRAVGRGCVSA